MANYQQWSESYSSLSHQEHEINNIWFTSMLSKLTDDGILYVPVLGKQFNKQGEEVIR